MNKQSFSSNKILKIIRNASFLAILGLFLSGNYFVVKAQSNSPEETPRVIAQAQTNIRELPRTGLPLLGLGLASLFPAGLLLKRLIKTNPIQEDSPNAIWAGRHLKG